MSDHAANDCKHMNLIKLEGPIHEESKTYLCRDCGDVFEVEVKPATIGVGYGEKGESK